MNKVRWTVNRFANNDAKSTALKEFLHQ